MEETILNTEEKMMLTIESLENNIDNIDIDDDVIISYFEDINK